MSQERQHTLEESLVLRYAGERADVGEVDLHDLAVSLNGWGRFLEFSISTYMLKRLTVRQLQPHERPSVRVVALGKGSFNVLLQVVLPLGLMASYDLAKALWRWRTALVKNHVGAKRDFKTKEEAIRALEDLAKRSQLEVSDVHRETERAIDELDEALNELAAPIGVSAGELTVASDKASESISLCLADKRALASPYFVGEGAADHAYIKAKVRFIRVNKQTGRALITFDNPQDEHQVGQKYSLIADSAVRGKKNEYARAFYEESSMEVWARMVRSRRDGSFAYWEITGTDPEPTPLLDPS